MVPMALIWWIYHFWARFWPYFNFVDFRAYFGPFSLVNGVKHENLSLNVNFWSITLKFFLWTPTTHEPEWLKELSSIQKKCKNGTPYLRSYFGKNTQPRVRCAFGNVSNKKACQNIYENICWYINLYLITLTVHHP